VLIHKLPSYSSLIKAVYDPKAFILHAALLHQAFAHCGIFLTAASRRSLDRVSVPVWLVILSDQLKIVGLVSHYLTNYLILRRPLPKRINPLIRRSYAALDSISGAYSSLWGMFPRVTQPSAARVPRRALPLDLHVLSTPPAFILSQDQTLHKNLYFKIHDSNT
jgi:hypothetical protein